MFTIDDAYIHLSMAENISRGSFGINPGEVAAASSSILWPFLLTPFHALPTSAFIINIICALSSLYFVNRCIELSLPTRSTAIHIGIVLFLIMAVNLLGLPFLGMEHSLQVLCISMTVFGLLREWEDGDVKWLTIGSIVGALVRYENLSFTLPVIVYLILRRRYWVAGLISVLTFGVIGLFSFFLYSNGLEVLPTSVTTKTDLASDTNIIVLIVLNLIRPFSQTAPFITALQALSLFMIAVFNTKHRLLCFVGVVAAIAHLAVGDYGWFGRYEMYSFLGLWLLLIYVLPRSMAKANWMVSQINPVQAILSFYAMVIVFCGTNIFLLYQQANAANAIYGQQFQMHVFVTEYYKKPVAVNDIGWVSYQNEQFVLDLFGLGSLEAREQYVSSEDFSYVPALMEQYDVELAMVHSSIFEDQLGEYMHPVGVLKVEGVIAPIDFNEVTFYATDEAAAQQVRVALIEFRSVLPENVSITLN